MIPGFREMSFYEVLDITPGVEAKEIQEGYYRVREMFGKNGLASYSLYSPELRDKILNLIEEAYRTLMDETDRAVYDRRLQEDRARQVKTGRALQEALPFAESGPEAELLEEPEGEEEEEEAKEEGAREEEAPEEETQVLTPDRSEPRPEAPPPEPMSPLPATTPELTPPASTPADAAAAKSEASAPEPQTAPVEAEPPSASVSAAPPSPPEKSETPPPPAPEPPAKPHSPAKAREGARAPLPPKSPALPRPSAPAPSSAQDGIKVLAGQADFGPRSSTLRDIIPAKDALPAPRPSPPAQPSPPPAKDLPAIFSAAARRTQPAGPTQPPPAGQPAKPAASPRPTPAAKPPLSRDPGAFEETVYDIPIPARGPSPLDYLGKDTSGKFLKELREARSLSLDQVYDATRIRRPILIAIEEENPKGLPADVFLKGMLLIYARFLELPDPEAFIKGYMSRVLAKREWMD